MVFSVTMVCTDIVVLKTQEHSKARLFGVIVCVFGHKSA